MTSPSFAPLRLAALGGALSIVILVAGCATGTGSVPSSSPAGESAAPVGSDGGSTAVPAAGSPTAGSPAAGSSTAAACTPPATPTTAQTEGPYFKAGSPERSSLADATTQGTHLTLNGTVVGTDCAPLAGVLVDVWQADASGAYDNAGYGFRGHVVTDANGRFTVETVVPGEYPGRTPHIHMKLTPQGGSTLTTQVYFPDSNLNAEDGIFRPELLLNITKNGDAAVGAYTFVLGG